MLQVKQGYMAGEDQVAAEIEVMKAELGVNLDRELAERLNIDPSAVAAWRRRGAVPTKYRLAHRRTSDERQIKSIIGADVGVSLSRLREAYAFALLDEIARTPVPSEFMHLPENWYTIWRGTRLANAYSYILDTLPATGTKDDLRAAFEEAKAEVGKPDFLEWLETV